MYGEKITNEIIRGNKIADKLANRALKREMYHIPKITPEHGDYMLAPALTPKENERRREIITNKCKEEIKEEMYEKRKKKWMEYIRKEHREKYRKIVNENIDWIETTRIYRNKNYQFEKNKQVIYKIQMINIL